MPQIEFDLSPDEMEKLEKVREKEGLETIQQAAEWLIKRRLRASSLKLTGRNRALYPVRTD